MRFKELLTKYRRRREFSKTEIARLMELSPGYMINLEAGHRKPPTPNRCRQLIKALGLNKKESKEFLEAAARERIPSTLTEFFDTSELFSQVREKLSKEEEYGKEAKIDSDEVIRVPLMNGCPAQPKSINRSEIRKWIGLPKEMVRGRRIYLLSTTDDSMNKRGIERGDMILIDADAQPKQGEIVVLRTEERETTLRRFFSDRDRVTLVADSTRAEYKPMTYEKMPEWALRGVVEGLFYKKIG